MRPPTSTRPSTARTTTVAPPLNGRISPAESVASTSTNSLRNRSPTHSVSAKRKERDFDQDGGEETNIHVVVRCRGRNEREVRENSGVVVSTDGVKGKTVELSMGPSALSNKTYHFDKVFSPAADQCMVFDEVVVPILDEVRVCSPATTDKILIMFRSCPDSTAPSSPMVRQELERHTPCQETSAMTCLCRTHLE